MSVQTRIEGYGLIPALQRQKLDSESITAIVRNTGSALLTPFTVTMYCGSWANAEGVFTISQGLLPGAMAYVTFQAIGSSMCDNVSPVWAKTTSSSWPALNSTSPQMAITWSTSVSPAASFSITSTTPTVNVATGAYAKAQYLIVNTGQFSLDFYGTNQVTPANSLLLLPADLGNPTHALVMNGTTQQTLVGSTPLFQGVGRLVLQPGQSIYVNRTFQVVDATISSILLGDTLNAKCLDSPSANAPDSNTGCGNFLLINQDGEIQPQGVGVSVTVSAVGATIQMVSAVSLGNGTEQFTGRVVTMGSNTAFLGTWFLFWKTAVPATQFKLLSGTVFSPGTVTATASGLAANTNYTVQFVVQGVGPAISSNTVTFTAAGCSGSSCSTGGGGTQGTSANFIQAAIFQFASAAGLPPELLGFIIGIIAFVTALLGIVVIESKAEVDLPPVFWAGFFPLMLVINVWLFFWPPLALILIIVPEAILIAREFLSGGGEASG